MLPPFTSRRHLPSKLAQLREIDGRTALRVRGQGTEFDSLRDCVVGDDVRPIDWRASARRQPVVVRTWPPGPHRRPGGAPAVGTCPRPPGRVASLGGRASNSSRSATFA